MQIIISYCFKGTHTPRPLVWPSENQLKGVKRIVSDNTNCQARYEDIKEKLVTWEYPREIIKKEISNIEGEEERLDRRIDKVEERIPFVIQPIE